jgi:uncharacterized protein (TIGR03000 family)
MRVTSLALFLAAFTVLASAGDVHAQRRGSGGWGGGYYPQARYYNSYYGGGYSPYAGYYNSYYGAAAYSPYYPGYGYGPSLSYYYPERAQLTPAIPAQSFYPGQEAPQQFAAVRVIVPTADAQVWFGNTAMAQQGTERLFNSPSLEPGKTFVYTIKARWMENGAPVERDRRVDVQAGQRVTVNFRDIPRETAPAPDAGPAPEAPRRN